tara:strand:+ start:408 stop:755 length:348 start_codon:yes stop_codon:yes gene_type:complete
MDNKTLFNALDKADKDLDAFPFWASFKRACAENPINDLGDFLTPGRQALLILWEANYQTKNSSGEIKSLDLNEKNIVEKIDQLKADLIGNFFEESIDEKALKKFFQSVTNKISEK